MLIDVMFFGMPLALAICLGAHAVRDDEPKFWMPSVSMLCYCFFYLGGGREVILTLGTWLLVAGGMLDSGGLVGP